MRSRDPELMEKIQTFVGEYYRREYESPSMKNIAEEFGISRTTAFNYLHEMDKKGMLSIEGNKITNLEKIRKTETSYISTPIVGSIRCGDPELSEAEVEMYVSLPKAIFGDDQSYLLRAEGDSMEDAGIQEGDLILIRKQESCEEGDIVVALDQNNENTLKIFGGINQENHKAVLRYANKEKYPGKVIEVSKLVIQGVARNVIKQL